MDRLIYTSLSAMRGAMARQQATANNLANASTPGFRAEIAEARALWLDGPSIEDRAMASEEVVSADMNSGSVTATGRELDIALSGDSLLAVQSAEGEEAYTRRGDLQLSPSGLLTTGDGRPVLGDGGPITIPSAGQPWRNPGLEGPRRAVPGRDGRNSSRRSRRESDERATRAVQRVGDPGAGRHDRR
jgi:flagellar basal-body rod protein FlgF